MTVFVAGLAAGLLIGGGVALLYAPQSGKETRWGIGRRFRSARRRGDDAWDALRFELRRLRRSSRRVVAPTEA